MRTRLRGTITITSTISVRVIVTAVVMLVVVAAAPGAGEGIARADDNAAATKLFDEGMALMEAKDYPKACARLREAISAAPGLLGAMLWLGDCYEKNGQFASAWVQFRQAAALAADKKDPREKAARKRITDLEPRLSYVTITVAPPPTAGLVVKRDAEAVGQGAWGSPLPVDAGEHEIVATAPKHREVKKKVTIAIAERAEVKLPALELDPAAAASESAQTPHPPVTPPQEPTSNTQRIVGYGVAAVGLIGVGLGTYFGLHAKSKLDDSNADNHCRQPGDFCDATGLQLRSDASSSATISTIAFVLGGAAMIGGVVLVLTSPRASSTATITIAPHTSGGAGSLTLTF